MKIAADDRYGYEWGSRGLDANGYDCSGLVTTAYIQAGVDISGDTSTMKSIMLQKGFVEHRECLNDCSTAQVGDIYIKEKPVGAGTGGHTVMYIGNNQIVHAAGNKDGMPGDSSGREITIADWYSGGWSTVLRYGS